MRRRFKSGGITDQDIAVSNVEMAHNLINAVQHHASEISDLVKVDTKVPAWVVSLLDRAEVDLSDVAHYIDGEMKKFGKGGETDEEIVRSNAYMTLSQIKAVKHHADELNKLVKRDTPIEAWVLSRLERAATYLSDVTHYLDGVMDDDYDKYEGYMAKGGKLPIVRTQFEEEEFDYEDGGQLSDRRSIVLRIAEMMRSYFDFIKDNDSDYGYEFNEDEFDDIESGDYKEVTITKGNDKLIILYDEDFIILNGKKYFTKDLFKEGDKYYFARDKETYYFTPRGENGAKWGKKGEVHAIGTSGIDATQFIQMFDSKKAWDDFDSEDEYADGGEIEIGDKVLYKNAKYHATVTEVVDDVEIPYAIIEYSDGKVKKAYLEDLRKVILRVAPEYVNSDYMAKGGEVAKEYSLRPMIPIGPKGFMTTDYKNSQRITGTYDEAVNKAQEMVNSNPNFIRVEIKREMKTKTITEGIVNGQMQEYKFGGDVGRFYKASDGNTYRFIGDQSDNKGIFTLDGKYVTKDYNDFDFIDKPKKLFGFFADGGMMAKGGELTPAQIKARSYRVSSPSETREKKKSDKALIKEEIKKIPKNEMKAIEAYMDNEDLLYADKIAKGGMMAKGGEVASDKEKLGLKILSALSGFSDGKTLNGILELLGYSNFRFNKYATDEQVKEVKKEINLLIKKGFIIESGIGYKKTQKGDDYLSSFDYGSYEKGGYMAKGGPVKRKRWIQDALNPEHKGLLRATAKRKHLIKGDEKLSNADLHKLEKMGGKTAQRAHFAETLRSFKKGGVTPVDMLEARQFFGDAEWSKLSRKDKVNSAKYLKRTGKIGYKKGGKLPELEESQE